MYRQKPSESHCYQGICTCGQVRVEIQLPDRLETYKPRACDCDFCKSHNMLGLSDSQGRIYIQSQQELEVIKQGTKLASFLTCPGCHDVIGVAYTFDTGSKAVLNANLLEARTLLQAPIPVSPKLLSSSERLHRWELTWSKIRLCTAPPSAEKCCEGADCVCG